MSSFLLLYLLFLLAPSICFARHINHIINIDSSSAVQFSSLAWDPVARNFVAGSISDPNVYAIPEVGTVMCLVDSEPSANSSGASVVAVAIDHIRQRLIVVFSNQSSVAAYDMQSYGVIFAVPLPELDGAASGVAVDLESGDVFVSGAKRGVVLKVGSEGETTKVISEFQISEDGGLGGLVHTSYGYIITVQPTTGSIFRVDSKSGEVIEVSYRDSYDPLAPEVHAITLQSNSSVAVATNKIVLSIRGDNTSWKKVSAHNKVKLGGHGKIVVALATREGKTYALVKSQGGYFIEEVYWGYEGKWNYVLYVIIALGLLAIVAPMCYDVWETCQQPIANK